MQQDQSDHLWPSLPIEFFVVGIPVSLQGSSASKGEWRDRVRTAAQGAVAAGSWALSEVRLAVSIVYFPVEPLEGDVDNRIKLILDGLQPHLLLDDALVDRIVVQRIHPQIEITFEEPTAVLIAAMASPDPTVYIRIDEAPLENILI
jgi:crossover junction endodeoxyribonuclease RusA